jgi:hypothetical protein
MAVLSSTPSTPSSSRERHVTRGADARIDDDGVERVAFFEVFEDDPNVVRVEHALARADGAASRHGSRRLRAAFTPWR